MTERVLVLPAMGERAGVAGMKTRWLIAWFCLSAAFAAEPEIEFTGLLATGKETQVALKRKNGEAQWLRLGQVFAGYPIASYEAKEETLLLTKDGQTLRLKMHEAKIAHANPEPPPEIKRAVLHNLRMLAAAADQYYLENGKSVTNYDALVGPTKYVKDLQVVAGENYRGMEFVQGRMMRVTTNAGHVITFDP